MNRLATQIQRFALVGMLNTGIGLSIIMLLMWWGAHPVAANAGGYAIGICVSYLLNRTWTFAADHTSHWQSAGKFLLTVLVAYGVNVLALWMQLSFIQISAYLAQIVAAAVYSITFFVLSRQFVFR